MSFSANVLRVLIASPSDLAEERKAAIEAIYEWNAHNAYDESTVLLPVAWETHAIPTTGIHPQHAINDQIVRSSDVLLGMFWTKIGTKTHSAESGTVEEIDKFVEAEKPALLYFSSKPINPNEIDSKQHRRLRKFQAVTYTKALVGSFVSIDELRMKISRDLLAQVRKMKAEMPRRSQTADARTKSEIRLTVAEDRSLMDVPEAGLYSLRRRFSLRVENTSQSRSLSQCRVQVLAVFPDSGHQYPRVLKTGLTLAAGDQVSVPMVSYGEAREPATFNCADSLIVLEGEGRKAAMQITEANRISIRATALDAAYVDLDVYVWVDQYGRLRISESAPPADSVGRRVERDVWLGDAIVRAFTGEWRRIIKVDVASIGHMRLHDLVSNGITKKAHEGKLPVWGKRQGSDVWELIDREFWGDNQISSVSVLIGGRESIRVVRTSDERENEEWSALMTSWQAVEHLWPKSDEDSISSNAAS